MNAEMNDKTALPDPQATIPLSEIAPEPSPEKKRKILLWLSVAVVVALALLLVAILWRESSNSKILPSPAPSFGLLPDANGTAGPIITVAPMPVLTGEAKNLTVTVAYQIQPQFTLLIKDLAKTNSPDNIFLFAPGTNRSYSTLQVLDSSGRVLSENKFTVPTQVAVDGMGGQGGMVTLNNPGTLDLTINLPNGARPQKVQIVSAGNNVMAERLFDFSNLRNNSVQASAAPRVSWWRQLLSFWSARAAEKQFVIAVINESAVDTFSLHDAVKQVAVMVPKLKPWSTFASRIRIVEVPNSQSLNCTTLDMIGDQYPICPDTGRVANVVSAFVPDWNAIVVLTNVRGNLGTVLNNGDYNFAPVEAMGLQMDYRLVAHESGHAVGKMADEYMYRFPSSSGVFGPNCFYSQDNCVAAIRSFQDPAAECFLGCNNVNTWRPSDRIMAEVFNPFEYGPLEESLMKNKIEAITGPLVSPSPSPIPVASASPVSSASPSVVPSCEACPVCSPEPSPSESPSPSVSASPIPSALPSQSSSPFPSVSASPSPLASVGPNHIQPMTSCPNNGLLFNGRCWYLGKANEYCSNTCYMAGMQCDKKGNNCQPKVAMAVSNQTRDLIGSNGIFPMCVSIATKLKIKFGAALDGALMGSGGYCEPSGETGTGCYLNLAGDLNRNTKCATTANGHDPTIKRICGCYDIQRDSKGIVLSEEGPALGVVPNGCPVCPICPKSSVSPNPNLAVTVDTSNPSLPAVTDARATSSAINSKLFMPPEGETYYVVQVFSADNIRIAQEQFYFITSIVGDGPNGGGTSQNNSLTIVLGIPDGNPPHHIRLTNENGTIISEKAITSVRF